MKIVKCDEVPVTVSPRGPKVRQLLALKDIAVTEVLLEPAQVLPRHSTPVDVVFYVKSGSGYVIIGDEKEPVTAGSLVESPKMVPHSLEAALDGIFDVLVLKTPNPAQVKKE